MGKTRITDDDRDGREEVSLNSVIPKPKEEEDPRAALEDFSGTKLSVKQSSWNSDVTKPKNPRSKTSIPVVKRLRPTSAPAKVWRIGKSAMGLARLLPIWKRKPAALNMDELLRRRVVLPGSGRCGEFREQLKPEHKTDDHLFVRESAFQQLFQFL